MACLPTAAARAWAARATLLLALPACAGAQAAPASPVTPALSSAASVQIVKRVAHSSAARVPDLAGLRLAQAARRLGAARLRPQAVALRPGARAVSGQWPEAGQPLPGDRTVVVWLGQPPVAPATAAAPPIASLPQTTVTPATVSLAPGPPPTSPQGQPAPAPAGTAPAPRVTGASTGEVFSGHASWYGPGFHGRTTACGNRFDEDAYTLASRDLPCGTTVRVTAPTGRSVTAVVDDWGPAAWTQRRFDLSKATFAAIHPLSAGVTTVTVEVLR